jgi:hypothetical protein
LAHPNYKCADLATDPWASAAPAAASSARLDREVFSKKLNEAIGEIPSQVISVVPGVEYFVDTLRTMYHFIAAFREIDAGLVDLAEDIANAEKYVTTYTSVLEVWSSKFTDLVKIATDGLSELNNTQAGNL